MTTNTKFTMAALIAGAYAAASRIGGSTGAIAEALEQKAQQKKEANVREALSILDQIQNQTTASVRSVKTLRKQERDAIKRLRTLNRAADFFSETENPLPWYKATGNPHAGYALLDRLGYNRSTDAELYDYSKHPAWEVPATFKDTVKTPEIVDDE